MKRKQLPEALRLCERSLASHRLESRTLRRPLPSALRSCQQPCSSCGHPERCLRPRPHARLAACAAARRRNGAQWRTASSCSSSSARTSTSRRRARSTTSSSTWPPRLGRAQSRRVATTLRARPGVVGWGVSACSTCLKQWTGGRGCEQTPARERARAAAVHTLRAPVGGQSDPGALGAEGRAGRHGARA